MIRIVERAGDRLLALVAPKLAAKAYCTPLYFCEWCTGGKTRWVYRGSDCNLYPGQCAPFECQP